MGSLLASGCSSTPPIEVPGLPVVHPLILEARWRATSAALQAISTRPRPKLDDVLADGRSVGRLSIADDLGRKAARTLLLSGAFRDLPEDARTHPMVQRTVIEAMPEMDEAVFGMHTRIGALTPTERADIARELRTDPELAERVLDLLDREAVAVGAAEARRMHLRKMGLHVCERLRESSELLLGEYTAKIDKLTTRDMRDFQVRRRLAVTMGKKAFADLEQRTLASHQRHVEEIARRADGFDLPAARSTSDGGTTLTVGGVLMGFAAVTGLIGGIVIATGSFAGAFVLTAAAVLLLVGLIFLIVGAAQKALA